MTVRLGTRASTLATTQSETVAAALRKEGLGVELVHITTHGDTSTASLTQLGGTGVFASAIRYALIGGQCDVAVHSFKDLPTAAPMGLVVAAVPTRQDPRDALVARDGLTLDTLPEGASVGTGSPRRFAQLLATRPDLHIVDIRGNVETRLGRVKGFGRLAGDGGREDLDAVVLACAGLERLGHGGLVTDRLDPDVVLPAPAQGALAVECRNADGLHGPLATALRAIDDRAAHLEALAERAVLARLKAGCAAPVGCLARFQPGGPDRRRNPDRLSLAAAVCSLDGTRSVRQEAVVELPPLTEHLAAAYGLGDRIAEDLLADGAAEIADLSASASTR
ncbi:hydroxymethylbilane synthase [Acidipropionibacterium timonense]|uniref:hydroxymethylbilane synthase n=1 Tax=Acidipropionibacterium timonense TaxID=2161818 RepID=UPI00102FAB16|nr:hydroxymethylbilane synthase [Acidipropionibacterium timonense]